MKEIIERASQRGFTHWATINGTKLQFMDRWGINLFVNTETNEFEMAWNIPYTIFQITCPSCSPFSNEDHFQKTYVKFKRTVRKCRDTLEEE